MPSLFNIDYFPNGYLYNIQNRAAQVWGIGEGHRGAYGNLTGTIEVVLEIDGLVSLLSSCLASWLAFHTC
jgi:hypothetical protein